MYLLLRVFFLVVIGNVLIGLELGVCFNVFYGLVYCILIEYYLFKNVLNILFYIL